MQEKKKTKPKMYTACRVCKDSLVKNVERKTGLHEVCGIIEESVGRDVLKKMPIKDIREVRTKMEFRRWATQNDMKVQKRVGKDPGIWIEQGTGRKKSKRNRKRGPAEVPLVTVDKSKKTKKDKKKQKNKKK